MNILALLIITMFWKAGNGQTIHYTTDEGYLLNVLARHISTPDDTTGVAVLQITKKDSLIYVQAIYNSLKDFIFLDR